MLSPGFVLWRDRSLRFAMGASATIAGSLLGIVRTKWLATHLEASGLGVLAQITSGQTWMGLLAGMGLSLPVTNVVGSSEGAGDADRTRGVVWTSILLVGFASVAIAVGGLLFASTISVALLGTPEHASLVRISMLGVAGTALHGVFLGLFSGRSDLKVNLTFAAAGGLAAVAITLALVPRWGLAGGALGLAVLAPAGVAVALLLHRRAYSDVFRPAPRPLFDAKLARSILGVGAAALVMSLAGLGTLIAVRAHYLRANGVEANGLLQAALAVSQQIGMLFNTYLSSYAFGKVSGLGDVGAVQAYTRRHWTPLVVLAAPAFGLAMVAATPLLHLLYSSRFDPARPMMAWTLLGEFLRTGMNIWAVGALPIGGPKLWLPVGLSTHVGLAGTYALLAQAGVGALSLPLAYVGAGAFSLVFCWIAMGRAGVTLGGKQLGVLAVCSLALGALAWWAAS